MGDWYESSGGILPTPREFAETGGECDVRAGFQVHGNTVDARIDGAIERLSRGLHPHDVTAKLDPCPVCVRCLPADHPHRDGYRLSVRPTGIMLNGGSANGCFYAIQTLRQLTERAGDSGLVPCCDITDWPDFDTRGLLHDVTRGKVPTLATLKLIVDRLAGLKGNQLQLNIEHAFVFSFDPEICSAGDGITPDEVRVLDAYCRERFVDLVPAVATLGHMGRILSMPKYRHLAECEAVTSWSDMDWTQRARGFTLDCANPDAHTLVERMWSDILDAFSGTTVNICGDEPHDLGQGKNRQRFHGCIGEAYMTQIRRVQDICLARGRCVQFWSDVVVKYPNLFGMIEPGATVLHWGYDETADYAGTSRFTGAGLRTFVCPGTSGWKRVLNAMNLAERNISSFAETGKACGAAGLLNTDWGDHGHFNLLTCSWHGIALGAVKAWRADHVTGAVFDALFAQHFFGLRDNCLVTALRSASESARAHLTWQQLWTPVDSLATGAALPSIEELDESHAAARQAIDLIRAIEPVPTDTRQDFADLTSACEFVVLWAEKMRLIHAARTTGTPGGFDARARAEAWCDGVRSATQCYQACWRARNKSGGLADIERALSRMIDDIGHQPW